MKNLLAFLFFTLFITSISAQKIDRQALVARNNPHITQLDTMASLNVGNGDFSFTADVTGLQSFPELYKNGVPLGTMSNWGWHSFPNTNNFRPEECLEEYDFGHGHKELYATQFKVDKNAPLAQQQRMKRKNDAANYFRANPHRLHLGIIGFDFPNNPWRNRNIQSTKTSVEDLVTAGDDIGAGKGIIAKAADIDLTANGRLTNIDQKLDMMSGILSSCFRYEGKDYAVQTVCNPKADQVAAHIVSKARTPICLRFPYPTGGHSDDACDWNANEKHTTKIISNTNSKNGSCVVLERNIDETTYWVIVRWQGKATFKEVSANYFTLTPKSNDWEFSEEYNTPLNPPSRGTSPIKQNKANQNLLPTRGEAGWGLVSAKSADVWSKFWSNTGVVDFSDCTDPRAPELERRVMLSQWLLATQCAGSTPPQETGLTYNSWFGKFHLEMIWWHQSWLPLYNHPKKATRTLKWY